jgi:hypothetical protein
MQHKTHWKRKRSIGCGIEFPICLHPTRSSAGENRRACGVNIDDVTVFDCNPHFDVPGDMHLQCCLRVGRTWTPKQETAAWATISSSVWCACRTGFDRARSTVRVSMGRTGRSNIRF